MGTKFEYDVFLSHSAADREVVHALAERLRGDGVRVWLDAWAIHPGDAIGMAIARGVKTSRTLVICMSPDYFESEWGKLEQHSMLFRDPANADRRFLPLLIGACSVPDIIAQFAHIDWRKPTDEAYAKLQSACREQDSESAGTTARKERISQAKMVLKGHKRGVWGVAITPDGSAVVSASNDPHSEGLGYENRQLPSHFRRARRIRQECGRDT